MVANACELGTFARRVNQVNFSALRELSARLGVDELSQQDDSARRVFHRVTLNIRLSIS